MDNFKIEIICRKCGGIDVHICSHLDFINGLDDDDTEYTGDIVLVCQNKKCHNRELVKLKHQIVY